MFTFGGTAPICNDLLAVPIVTVTLTYSAGVWGWSGAAGPTCPWITEVRFYCDVGGVPALEIDFAGVPFLIASDCIVDSYTCSPFHVTFRPIFAAPGDSDLYVDA